MQITVYDGLLLWG